VRSLLCICSGVLSLVNVHVCCFASLLYCLFLGVVTPYCDKTDFRHANGTAARENLVHSVNFKFLTHCCL